MRKTNSAPRVHGGAVIPAIGLLKSLALALLIPACETLIGGDFDSAFDRRSSAGAEGRDDAELDSSESSPAVMGYGGHPSHIADQGGDAGDGRRELQGGGGGVPMVASAAGTGGAEAASSAGGHAGMDGSGATGACGAPTPELDPDGDLLNDECDTDDDEDGILDPMDTWGRRDPLVPVQSPPSNYPGVMLTDGCVQAAVNQASRALRTAGLADAFPLQLEHTPGPFAALYVQPWGATGGNFVAGSLDTPGAHKDGAEMQLVESAPQSYSFYEYRFDDGGGTLASSVKTIFARGNQKAFTLYSRLSNRVTLRSGSFSADGLVDVAELNVRVSASSVSLTYPNASCPPALAGRWSVAWIPRIASAEPSELTYFCVDDGVAHHPGSGNWTRGDPPETCRCLTTFQRPGVGGQISCQPL